MSRIYDSLYERLMAHIDEPENEQACWLWNGNLTPNGYGSFQQRVPNRSTPRKFYVHRELEQLSRGYNEFDLDDDPLGPILIVERPRMDPDEETIEHLCGVRHCENPDHRIVVTRSQNSKLMFERVYGHGGLRAPVAQASGEGRHTELDSESIGRELHRAGGAVGSAVGESVGVVRAEAHGCCDIEGDGQAVCVGSHHSVEAPLGLRADSAVELADHSSHVQHGQKQQMESRSIGVVS